MRILEISKDAPRSLESVGINFQEGYLIYKIIGVTLIVFTIFCYFVMIFESTQRFKEPFYYPYFMITLMLLGGVYILYHVKNSVALRQKIFMEGKAIEAEVISHGRQFSVYKSSRDYALNLQFQSDKGMVFHKVVNSSFTLLQEYPVGSKVCGLAISGKAFFAQDIGHEFRLRIASDSE